MLEGLTDGKSLGLNLSQEVPSMASSWGLGWCCTASEFFIRLSILASPELGGICCTLPLSDLVLVVHNEVYEGAGDGDVSLIPCGVLVLLELKDFEAIEVDGVDGLFLPFLVKHGIS